MTLGTVYLEYCGMLVVAWESLVFSGISGSNGMKDFKDQQYSNFHEQKDLKIDPPNTVILIMVLPQTYP